MTTVKKKRCSRCKSIYPWYHLIETYRHIKSDVGCNKPLFLCNECEEGLRAYLNGEKLSREISL